MSLEGKWTIFQIEAEIDQFGLHRLVNAHNMLVSELKYLKEESSKTKKKSTNKCTCHERDSSYVCEYCYSQGHRGHMQK